MTRTIIAIVGVMMIAGCGGRTALQNDCFDLRGDPVSCVAPTTITVDSACHWVELGFSEANTRMGCGFAWTTYGCLWSLPSTECNPAMVEECIQLVRSTTRCVILEETVKDYCLMEACS